MSLFDRYSRLRDAMKMGRLHTGQKEILALLSGRLSKSDLPAVVAEPAGESEMRTTLAYAAEKHLKVAVASGLKPAEVRGLEGQMLILTTRMTSTPVFSTSRQRVHVDAGVPIESLAVDLTRAALRWPPLLPVPSGLSVAEVLSSGWEGLRNWQDGSILSHLHAVEWMGSEGKVFRSGPGACSDTMPDVSGFLFGSHGRLGIITALEFSVEPVPQTRTAVLFELPDAHSALSFLMELRETRPAPETVIYWGETATSILRDGNDNFVSREAHVLLSVEWPCELQVPDEWAGYAKVFTAEEAIAALWQNLFRFSRTASRLYPGRTSARLHFPASAIIDLEEAARELGKDSNLPVALWGTLEAGHLHMDVMQPDGQPRTTRTAEELLKRLVEVAVSLGGCCAAGNSLPFETRTRSTNALTAALRDELRKKCDPHDLFVPLVNG